MKVIILVLALVSLGSAAPQPRKIFHEHVEDFLDIIFEEAGEEITRLSLEYIHYEEFWAAAQYMTTNSFRSLVAEMETLPEFNAVVEFLENDNIDIMFFIDRIHETLDSLLDIPRPSEELDSGFGFNSFISAVTASFPKDRLAALFEEKMETDEEFSVAIENLRSNEWEEVYNALWNNEVFQAEVQTFKDNGIDMDVLYEEVLAMFGQN